MWPWEHLAVGYVAFSLLAAVAWRRPPSDAAAFAVVLGTQFPDLVDKPLSWGLGVLPSGTTLAHSLLFAVPLCVFVVLLAQLAGRGGVGLGFAVGYLAHLPADALYPVLLGGDVKLWFLVWPLRGPTGGESVSILAYVEALLADFVSFVTSPAGATYLTLELVLLVLAAVLWVRDGFPGLPWRPAFADPA